MTDRGGATQPCVGDRMRRRLPTLGLDALAMILLPSYGVHASWISEEAVGCIQAAVNASHAITGFICVLIVGSILSLDFRPLAKTLPRLLLVALLASMTAVLAGTVAGHMTGMGGSKALFMVVVPVLSGGLNAGALPLALGYGSTFGNGNEILAALLPPVLLGNLAAIVVAGALGTLGHRRGAAIEMMPLAGKVVGNAPNSTGVILVVTAVALLMAATAGAHWFRRLTGISEPISLLALSGILLATNVLPRTLRSAIDSVYRFSAKVFIVPVLIIVGLLYSPWDVLVSGFSLNNLLVVATTVGMLCVGGYLLSLVVKLEPIDGSIVTLSRAAMGGTGDIAMLSAAHRLYLMPFAQIVTRLGGGVTVFFALLAS